MSHQDSDIVRRISQGDRRAYAELIDRHKDRAMTLALRMLKNRADAEEALQDAFVRAFGALSTFENKSTFATWFYRIVFNVCSTQLSKRPKQREASYQADADEGGAPEPVSDDMPDVDYESAEFQSIVHDAIGAMPEQYAAVLTLFYVQEMGYDEIVEVTGLPLGTVKNRLFRARVLLQRSVLKRLGEGEYA
ncbi:MAG TPA: sigma-70 family RNA polymerase sigma factor [Bacteroidota bacterium]|nr:sigma-70 family RNA polymerase sigma factor [Bacteroidota bacterium]